jgi:uncharacterized protein YlxP (DUF503 family)
MKVLVSQIELLIPDAMSLKDKRNILRGMKQRIWSKFKVSISEIDHQGSATRAVLGLSCVSNDSMLLDRIMNKIIRFIEECYPGLLHTYDYTVEHY